MVVLSDLYHAMTWPSLSYVAEDSKGRIVGYVLAKMYVPRAVALSLRIMTSGVIGRKISHLGMSRTGT